MSETILVFLKVGSRKNITDLYENGTVYMNTLDYFRRVDDGGLRGDPNEGVMNMVNAKNVTARFSFMNKDIVLPHISYKTFIKFGNLYCVYSISSNWFINPNDFFLDKKNIDFGSHALIIKQPGVFIEKIENALTLKDYKLQHNFVRYSKNKERSTNRTIFDKSDEYDYQKEFRFFVENDKSEPLKINIGSMKSYSEIIESKKLPTLKLQPKNKQD